MWYPAVSSFGQPFAEYMPPALRKAVENQMGFLLTNFATRDLSRVRTHSIRDAELLPKRPVYPVVLMRGGHSALVTDYSTFAENLASHGYFVVAFDAPYRTFVTVGPDGKVVARSPQNNAEVLSGADQKRAAEKLIGAWSADMSFALDQLAQLNANDPSGRFRGRIDLEHVGVFGHSLGGAEALQFCHDDARCKAVLDLDGAPIGKVISEGVTQPCMFVLGDHSHDPEAESTQVMADIHSIYDRLPSDRRHLLFIRGANHFNFSDAALLRVPLLMHGLRRIGVVKLDGRRQLEVSEIFITKFFDVYLRGVPMSMLANRPDFPEADFTK
jgi:predicted dienelactone hydrolase